MKNQLMQFGLIIVLVFTSCSDDQIKGTGPVVTQELELASFESISFMIAGKVTLVQGEQQQVLVSSNANIIERLETDVTDDTWEISFSKGSYYYDYMDILISVPSFHNVTLAGAGSIMIEPFKDSADKQLELLGSGNFDVYQLEGPRNVSVTMAGSGSITVHEESSLVETLDIRITGSGDFNGFNIPSTMCGVSIAGTGNAEVTVNERLEGSIDGSGIIFYKGTPDVSVNITGSGGLRDAN